MLRYKLTIVSLKSVQLILFNQLNCSTVNKEKTISKSDIVLFSIKLIMY